MKRILVALLLSSLATAVFAQEASDASANAPLWDVRQVIVQNHIHQISGATTLVAAALTGTAGVALAAGVDWSALPSVHGALAYTTLAAGATTLALGLTAYSDRLDRVWPHAMFMGLAETGFMLNAFVLEPGSLLHRITGAASITSLGLGLLSIILINGDGPL